MTLISGMWAMLDWFSVTSGTSSCLTIALILSCSVCWPLKLTCMGTHRASFLSGSQNSSLNSWQWKSNSVPRQSTRKASSIGLPAGCRTPKAAMVFHPVKMHMLRVCIRRGIYSSSHLLKRHFYLLMHQPLSAWFLLGMLVQTEWKYFWLIFCSYETTLYARGIQFVLHFLH